jgi:hypothetical protein
MNKVSKLNESSSMTPSSMGQTSSEATSSVLPYSSISSMDVVSANTDRSTLSSSSYHNHDRHLYEVGMVPSSFNSSSPSTTNMNRNHRDRHRMKIPSRSIDDDYYDEGVSRMSSFEPMTGSHPALQQRQEQLPYGSFKSNTIDATSETKTQLMSTTKTSWMSKVGHGSSAQSHEWASPTTSGYPVPPNTFSRKPGVDQTTPKPSWLLGNQVPRSHQQESSSLCKTSLAAPLRQFLRVNQVVDMTQSRDRKNYRTSDTSITSSTTTGSVNSLMIEEEEAALVEATAKASTRPCGPVDVGYCANIVLEDGDDKDTMTHDDFDYSESSYYVDDDYTDLASVETNNPQVIAIGIEAPTPRCGAVPPHKLARDNHTRFSSDDSSTAIVMNNHRRSPEQLKQELLSEATAKDIAQEEHNLKMHLKAAEEQQGQKGIRRRSAPALVSSTCKQPQTLLTQTGTGSQQPFAGRHYRGPGLSVGRFDNRFLTDGIHSNAQLGGSCNPTLQSLSENDTLQKVDEKDGISTSLHNSGSLHDDDTLYRAIADGIKSRPINSHLMTPPRFQGFKSSLPNGHSMSSGSHSLSSVTYDDSVPSESPDRLSSRDCSASDRDVKLQSVRGAMGVSTKGHHRIIPPSYERSHSTTSTAPPIQPIRKLSTDRLTMNGMAAKEETVGDSAGDFDEVDESICEPPSLWSFESMQSSQSTRSNTSGIDLD